ncbi:hypothetical protein [Bacillus swezeyi]|uniref:hypothetical protein n=1 Tax=Bacillus swezeyi TaxID=1925020 RepID=UPI0027DD099B|nr:hypothetical protein [Bacillus swezeyi]
MGAVHNIPNYIAVSDFLQLGLSPFQVIVSLVISSFLDSLMPCCKRIHRFEIWRPIFMHLRHTHGDIGANCQVYYVVLWLGFPGFDFKHLLVHKLY